MSRHSLYLDPFDPFDESHLDIVKAVPLPPKVRSPWWKRTKTLVLWLTTAVIVSIVILSTPWVINAWQALEDAEDVWLMVDGQTLSIGKYDNILGAGQVHPKKSARVINRDPMKPAHVYKWTSDSTRIDLGYVRFRAPLTSEGLYEFASASQSRFARLNWED